MKKSIGFLFCLCLFMYSLEKATDLYFNDYTQNMEKITAFSQSSYGYLDNEESFGCTVTGSLNNGLLNGVCLIKSNDGKFTYEGEILLGKYHGYGTIRVDGRTVYSGMFKEGLYNGFGTLNAYENDKKILSYEGNFKNGVKEGYGALDLASVSYTGEFTADRYNDLYIKTKEVDVPSLKYLDMKPTFNFEDKDVSSFDVIKDCISTASLNVKNATSQFTSKKVDINSIKDIDIGTITVLSNSSDDVLNEYIKKSIARYIYDKTNKDTDITLIDSCSFYDNNEFRVSAKVDSSNKIINIKGNINILNEGILNKEINAPCVSYIKDIYYSTYKDIKDIIMTSLERQEKLYIKGDADLLICFRTSNIADDIIEMRFSIFSNSVYLGDKVFKVYLKDELISNKGFNPSIVSVFNVKEDKVTRLEAASIVCDVFKFKGNDKSLNSIDILKSFDIIKEDKNNAVSLNDNDSIDLLQLSSIIKGIYNLYDIDVRLDMSKERAVLKDIENIHLAKWAKSNVAILYDRGIIKDKNLARAMRIDKNQVEAMIKYVLADISKINGLTIN